MHKGFYPEFGDEKEYDKDTSAIGIAR